MQRPKIKRDARIKARYVALYKKLGTQEKALYALCIEEEDQSGLSIHRLKQICTADNGNNEKKPDQGG